MPTGFSPLSLYPFHILEIYQVIWIPSDFIGLVLLLVIPTEPAPDSDPGAGIQGSR